MTAVAHDRATLNDPLAGLLASESPAVLAVISDVEGPSYRPLGAAMTVFTRTNWIGTLSSGCIEGDIALHAMEALRTGRPTRVRYGRGSPYIDIKLPCGGGLEILLLPRPDRAVIAQVQAHRAARRPVTIDIDIASGTFTIKSAGATARTPDRLTIRYEPELHFVVFGTGPEACTFAALAQAAGYTNLLLSPDEETLACGRASGCATRDLPKPAFPESLEIDHRTAVVLFFHDHEWEPDILAGALATRALYIGAQGSRAARMTRNNSLRGLGVSEADIARIAGPIGLIHSARDARTLAISVLAEVVGKLMEPQS